MEETKNVYPDEQVKLDDEFKLRLELSMKISDLLDTYGYTIEAVLVDGLPEIDLKKVL